MRRSLVAASLLAACAMDNPLFGMSAGEDAGGSGGGDGSATRGNDDDTRPGSTSSAGSGGGEGGSGDTHDVADDTTGDSKGDETQGAVDATAGDGGTSGGANDGGSTDTGEVLEGCDNGAPFPGDLCYESGDLVLAGPAHPHPILVADVLGDGYADIVPARRSGPTVLLIPGMPGGLDAPEPHGMGGGEPQAIDAADIDGDGLLDFVVADRTNDVNVRVLRSETGWGQTGFQLGGQPAGAVFAEMTGDDDLDLVVALANDDALSVLPGAGNGTFDDAGVNRPVGERPYDVIAADLDDDGDVDLATTNSDGGDISVLYRIGAGALSKEARFGGERGGNPDERSLAVGDLDDDGHPELITASESKGRVTIYWNDGDGGFADTMELEAIAQRPVDVQVGDFDTDGHLDIAIADWDAPAIILLIQQPGREFAPAVFAQRGDPWALDVGDVNGDGVPDVATSLHNVQRIGYLLSTP